MSGIFFGNPVTRSEDETMILEIKALQIKSLLFRIHHLGTNK